MGGAVKAVATANAFAAGSSTFNERANRRASVDSGAAPASLLQQEPRLINDTTDEDEAEVLLTHARAKSTFLQQLEPHDIQSIIKHLTVLEFDEGETIMVKGEAATWVGILLSGELSALVDGKVVGTMDTGKIVGEVAFFSAGNRMADVRAERKGFSRASRGFEPAASGLRGSR